MVQRFSWCVENIFWLKKKQLEKPTTFYKFFKRYIQNGLNLREQYQKNNK